MNITIRPTVAEEAERLAEIQKAAFLPLYEKYHDRKSPYLRGADDILRRIAPECRCFTILCDGAVIGCIWYHLSGKGLKVKIKPNEYYLGRMFIAPEYQCRGIGSTVILMCEGELPEAEVYYVDFPLDMDKNRRCYEKAGFEDTGETITEEGAPILAVYKKRVRRK